MAEGEGVFLDIFPAEWGSDPDFCIYIRELSGYPLSTLKKEPLRLTEAREVNKKQTQDLAFKNYKTFIQTADCSRDVFSEFGTVESRLDTLLDSLPHAINSCNTFHEKANSITHERKMNNLTKTRYTELLELLEIPQLMDTTVRNGYYDEALELIEFVRKLEKKYSSISVISDIVQAVKQSSHLLLNHLLNQLKTNIQLPACLRVIGYLRRMNCFSEAELRIKFLQARDHWLQTNLKTIPDNEPHTHIMKIVESSRVHMFDIITQYRAIFSDEDSNEASESILFHSWVVSKITEFLEVLEFDLNRGCVSHLEAILGQSMYFGLSFSRVGADFRPQLIPIFLKAAERHFNEQIDKAEQEFLDHMNNFQLSDSVSLFSAPISTAVGVSIQPPPSLLEYLPLAVLANGCQTAFSNLRLCCPLALGPLVKRRLTISGQKVVERVTQLHRAEAASFSAREKDSFSKLCSTVSSELLPFLNHCLNHLFPSAALAETLGIPVRQSVDICQLKINQICEPLQQHIPKEDEIILPEAIEEILEKPVEISIETEKPIEPEMNVEKSGLEEESEISAENSVVEENVEISSKNSVVEEKNEISAEIKIPKEQEIVKVAVENIVQAENDAKHEKIQSEPISENVESTEIPVEESKPEISENLEHTEQKINDEQNNPVNEIEPVQTEKSK